MQDNQLERPVGGNELARAFAWRVTELASEATEIGLFLPAMTLFDNRATEFRQKFFQQPIASKRYQFFKLGRGHLRRAISSSRSFFLLQKPELESHGQFDKVVKVFSPLVANQEVTRPSETGERVESWCIVVNEAEICDIDYADILDGSGLPWKIASWGSHHDVRLLRRLARQYDSLGHAHSSKKLIISEGPALREKPTQTGEDKTEFFEELVTALELQTSALARLRHLFSFSKSVKQECTHHHLRLRAGRRTMEVCRGPHVIVSAARNFAVYEEDYLVVPSRQIGIISPADDRDLLKALSLYLSSDFALYHQLFMSTEFGVKRDRATLDALKQMPCPLFELSRAELKPWVALHAKLCKTTPRIVGQTSATRYFFEEEDHLDELLIQLNDMVSAILGLSERERALISDFVNVRLELNDGKVGPAAVRKPEAWELKTYAERLQQELDAFLGEDSDHHHSVSILHDNESGFVCVDFEKSKKAAPVTVSSADRDASSVLAKTRKELQHRVGQWLYFNRNLRIYEGTKTYLFKPMQRFHWTQSQAMVDASEIIAETMAAEGAVD